MNEWREHVLTLLAVCLIDTWRVIMDLPNNVVGRVVARNLSVDFTVNKRLPKMSPEQWRRMLKWERTCV